MRSWNDDPFTKKARKEAFVARSIYKLEEIDQREKIFSGVKSVIDLGAAPGSWTQYCLKRIPTDGKILAIDISPLKIDDKRVTFLQKDIAEVDFGSLQADLVLSDMAPKTSGIHDADVARSTDLAEMALKVAIQTLKPGGAFVVKLFMGDSFKEYEAHLKSHFSSVKCLRPESTRKHSREIFFIAKGRKS